MVPVALPSDRDEYARHRRWLQYSLHELPTGVLWGTDGATPVQCGQMLDELEEFSAVCARLGLDDHDAFIEACRWHFDHYRHYLGRRQHFKDYETYVRDRCGPLGAALPPAPN